MAGGEETGCHHESSELLAKGDTGTEMPNSFDSTIPAHDYPTITEANSATVLPKDKTAGLLWFKNHPISTSSSKVQHEFIFKRVSIYCTNL
jgi:hypothetical protein